MIRPPSLQNRRDDYFSGDPAFTQLPEDATDEQKVERRRLVTVARETGDWSAFRIEGQEPTQFVFKPLRGEVYRTLMDRVAADVIGAGIARSLAFRAAIVDIPNLPGMPKIKPSSIDGLGEIATSAISDYLDSITPRIVTELGGVVLNRAGEVSPK